MIIQRFKADHIAELELQDAQAYFGDQLMTPGYAEMLEAGCDGFTALADGQVVACAGCTEIWTGRAIAWALISKDAGLSMVPLHRAVSGYLMASKHRRIEAWVDVGFDAGSRWLEMLGFTCETPSPMQGFRPDGGACFLYARVKT